MPEDFAWKLLEIGRVIDPPKTAALYAPLQQKEPYQGVKIDATSNTARPTAICSMSSCRRRHPSARPVLIFVHGGGFVGGNKRRPTARSTTTSCCGR